MTWRLIEFNLLLIHCADSNRNGVNQILQLRIYRSHATRLRIACEFGLKSVSILTNDAVEMRGNLTLFAASTTSDIMMHVDYFSVA